jgi:hypothetical protein
MSRKIEKTENQKQNLIIKAYTVNFLPEDPVSSHWKKGASEGNRLKFLYRKYKW